MNERLLSEKSKLLRMSITDLESWFERWYGASWNYEVEKSLEEVVEVKKIIERLKTISKL